MIYFRDAFEYFCWFIALVTVLAIGAVIFAIVADIAIEKNNRIRCIEYQHAAMHHPLFWITESDAEMCDTLEVHVDAPVR